MKSGKSSSDASYNPEEKLDKEFRIKTSTDGWINREIYLALLRKSMEVKKTFKKASETGEMASESFVSLVNHFEMFECVFKVVWCGLIQVGHSKQNSLCRVLDMFAYVCVIVFVCLFRPCLAQQRTLKKPLG